MASSAPRAVVVDDSHFMRTVITDMLESGGVNVVDSARNGLEAVRSVEENSPDVVTMDVEMPEMDGIEAVERIMDRHPTPVLMLSAHTEDGAEVTFEALESGAVDFLAKPGGEVSIEMNGFEDRLVETVRAVAACPVSAPDDTADAVDPIDSADGYLDDPTVVIGASTGGPNVVDRVLAGLPRGADLRVLIVQHMPDGFTRRFADRLDQHTEYAVREASDGDRIEGGEAVVAPGGYHLSVSGYRRGRIGLTLTEEPPINGVRPAIDVTMESAAERIDGPLVGAVLTGMGEDGARGAAAIQRAGGTVIVQDESTSAVFGMPKRAIETGCVDAVLPESALANGILDAIER